ncbi:MAG TPA: hypothetical protein VL463_29530 [Kofleriaceae bacterium]|nr:hypothetical protein [Kofleriaceae bacterium]
MRWLVAVCLLGACGSSSSSNAPDAPAGTPDAPGGVEDLDMKASDFECVLHWTQVANSYRITNKLGHDPLATANSPVGGDFPVGTIIQIVPTEAMVKRRAGFSAATHDWEFFALSVSSSGTTIDKRGTADVVNAFNGNCLGCHAKAMPQWDFVCGTTHGCDALPLSTQQLVSLQDNDPRCP